jgi:hypothetical protein
MLFLGSATKDYKKKMAEKSKRIFAEAIGKTYGKK